ncbi:hypothetical protein [Pedobacter africanus]|uniref:SPOR domain-containing protein n=1 Tax=Pedobacter africanus TaxID=151894 RepID=A0A1W2CWD6_9SPHI|nr:hypothetical protein [Pedobacter africanus]SMC89162.1 hypothetical protein SAMN04488524_3286 [Pedobacter africanus]
MKTKNTFFLIIAGLILLISCNQQSNNNRASYVVNKTTTSCMCRVQLVGEVPKYGEKHLGPFNTKEEARRAMCKDIDPTMTDQKKCWETVPEDACNTQ